MSKGMEAFKLLGIAILWLSIGRVLPEILWRALPDGLVSSMSLPAYSMLCQVATTVIGIGTLCLAFARPGAALGTSGPTGWNLALAAMLAPAVFVFASFVAIKIAEPYLLEELAREGAGASRKNAGAFGRAVTEAPLLVTLVWGAVLAAVAEELAFRGALFSAIEKSALLLFARNEPPIDVDAPPGKSRPALRCGVVAAVLAAAAFGAMHADMKGSVGIVRVASATCLGLACGSARLVTGTVFVPMILHFVYNSVSLALSRGLFRGDSEPLVSVVPNRLLVLGAVGAFLAIGTIVARRALRDQA
jgi:membrane protease YdiL (CAAX protease family)